MGTLIHRIKRKWSFRRKWAESLKSGVIEVSKLRAMHDKPKEHNPNYAESNKHA